VRYFGTRPDLRAVPADPLRDRLRRREPEEDHQACAGKTELSCYSAQLRRSKRSKRL